MKSLFTSLQKLTQPLLRKSGTGIAAKKISNSFAVASSPKRPRPTKNSPVSIKKLLTEYLNLSKFNSSYYVTVLLTTLFICAPTISFLPVLALQPNKTIYGQQSHENLDGRLAQLIDNTKLTVLKTTSTPSVAQGGAATYKIKVSNPSTKTITNVSITDPLPAGFTYDATIGTPSLQNSAIRTGTVNPTAGSSNLNWGTFTLPPTASVTVTFTANIISSQATGTYQNPVSVTYIDNGSQTVTYDPSTSTAEDVLVTTAPPVPPAIPIAPIRSSAGICAMPGKDGEADLSGIINTYYQPDSIGSSVSAGATSIILGSALGATTPIGAGDMLLIIQMQDAAINSNNDATYGAGGANSRGQTSMGQTGLYEYVVAKNTVATSGGTLQFQGAGSGGGLINSYSNAAATTSQGQRRFQIVRVPQYSSLTLNNTLSALKWNGQVGGIVTVDVAGQMNFNTRTIDGVNGGFRGGYSQKSFSGNSLLDSRGTDMLTIGAGKGEGTAGTPRFVWNGTDAVDNTSQGYPNGDFGRGAPANAGGGGNFHNAGGGGGGNGGIGGNGGRPWAGAGDIDSGGRGGGLSSLITPAVTRLFLGGGGGGGDANNATTGVRGGVGGGLVMLRTGTIVGSGTIDVTGDAGDVGAFANAPDGAGGGGSGGTVLISSRQTSTSANLVINAQGGAGGNTLNDSGNEHGPGGGGSGGVIMHYVPGVSLSNNIVGGVSGKANGGIGIAHGAEVGGSGQVISFAPGSDPFATVNDENCLPQLTVWKSTTTPKIAQGGIATYKITVSNGFGRATAIGVDIRDVLPTGFSYDSTTAVAPETGVTRTSSTNPTVGDTTATWGKFDIPAGKKVEIVFKAISATTIATGTYQNPAAAIYPDPQRVNATDTVTTSYNAAASTGEDVEVSAPIRVNANVLLVKRITAINGDRVKNPNDPSIPLNGFFPTINNPATTNDDNANWPSGFLVGAYNAGKIKPSDEIEYTIYFLNGNGDTASSVKVCDRLVGFQSFVNDAYGTGKDIEYQLGTNPLRYLTKGVDLASDRARLDGSTGAIAGCPPPTITGTNNSTVVIDVTGTGSSNQDNINGIPGATGQGTPANSYGYFRFKTKVNP